MEVQQENGKLVKYRVCMTIGGNQQVAGESFVATDLYAPVLKAHEARLLLAIATVEGCLVYKPGMLRASRASKSEPSTSRICSLGMLTRTGETARPDDPHLGT